MRGVNPEGADIVRRVTYDIGLRRIQPHRHIAEVIQRPVRRGMHVIRSILTYTHNSTHGSSWDISSQPVIFERLASFLPLATWPLYMQALLAA